MIRKAKRSNIQLHVWICFVCQIVLVYLIFNYLITDYDMRVNFTKDVSIIIMFVRFICGTILHLSLIDEVCSGLENMKFCLNQSYLFQSYKQAWLVGFLQTFITVCVEVVNIEIILTSLDPVEIVYNFIALAIIAEFDDFVFSSLRNECMKKLCESEFTEKIVIIRHTTSKKCLPDELSTVRDENGNLRPLKITFGSRECANKCMYTIYKVMRAFYVGIYFYFMPFTTILLTCIIPIL